MKIEIDELRPNLISNYREFLYLLVIFGILFSMRIATLHSDYMEFISKPFYFTTVRVLQEYKRVAKVYSKELDLEFFTTIYKPSNFIGNMVRLKLFPSKEMGFGDYLRRFYIRSYTVRVFHNPTLKSHLLKRIEVQHQDKKIVEFYQAIFLAHGLSKGLREQVSKLGISHLIALSGLHLSLLSGVLFYILNLIYKPFQQRYFPYRFNLIDIGFLILVALGWFVWLVDFPPSLIRSYIMMLLGWILLIFGLELLSFSFLTLSVMIILLLFPKMVLSLGFWLSVLGVFYIFLILDYFQGVNRYLLTLLISIGLFILMLPVVHTIFPITAKLQLYSPLISLLFIPFYPLSLLSHILGVGYIFDAPLLKLFLWDTETYIRELPFQHGVIYLILSIGAVFSKWLFYLLLSTALVYGLYIYF